MTNPIRDTEEWMDDKPKQVLEADQSITIKAYYKSYSLLITKRDDTAKILPMIEDAMKAIDWMASQADFKPSWSTETNNAASVPQKENLGQCEKCGAPNLRSQRGKIYCKDKCWLK